MVQSPCVPERFWQLCCHSSVDTWSDRTGLVEAQSFLRDIRIYMKVTQWTAVGFSVIRMHGRLPLVKLLLDKVRAHQRFSWGGGHACLLRVTSAVPSCSTGLCVGNEPQRTTFSISDQSKQQPTIQFWGRTEWQEEEKTEDGPSRSQLVRWAQA